MKSYFITEIQGRRFEFNRISNSSFDIWYHITAALKKGDVLYRMPDIKEGVWKIITPRMSPFIHSCESDCCEAIKNNETSI